MVSRLPVLTTVFVIGVLICAVIMVELVIGIIVGYGLANSVGDFL